MPGHGGSCCKGPEESEAGVFEEPEGGLGGTQGERAERVLGLARWVGLGLSICEREAPPWGPVLRGSPASSWCRKTFCIFLWKQRGPQRGGLSEMDLESPPLAAFPGIRAVHTDVTLVNTRARTHDTRHRHTHAGTHTRAHAGTRRHRCRRMCARPTGAPGVANKWAHTALFQTFCIYCCCCC